MCTKTDLGFLEECDNKWLLTNRYFPSKVGGKPAWLNLKDIPSREDLTCSKCQEPRMFLCQVYAPIDNQDDCFHRTLFVFMCKTKACFELNTSSNFQVFRNQLPLQNEFYSTRPSNDNIKLDPIESPVKLCNVCGCRGPLMCSKCKTVNYCGAVHQKIDWKFHKTICGSSDTEVSPPLYMFPEFDLVMEEEIEPTASSESPEEKERIQMAEYEKLLKEGKTGDMSEVELEQYAQDDIEDKTFAKFKTKIDSNPDQVLRYCRSGVPLWISPANKLKSEDVPKCDSCGENRIFEFQIMPQLINSLDNDDIDWGVIAVFTCSESCSIDSKYVKEFVYKQDILPETSAPA